MLLSQEEFKAKYGDCTEEQTYTGGFGMDEFPSLLGEAKLAINVKDLAMQSLELFVTGQFPSRGWRGNPREQLERRKEVFDELMVAGRKFVKGFYDGNPLSAQEVWDHFYPIYRDVELFSFPGTGERDRFLNGYPLNLLKFAHALQGDVEARSCDHLVMIASGGVEPGLLAMEYLGIEETTPLAFSVYHYKDRKVCLPFWLWDKGKVPAMEGKNVLLVDDALSRGYTFEKVSDFVKLQGAKNIVKRSVVRV